MSLAEAPPAAIDALVIDRLECHFPVKRGTLHAVDDVSLVLRRGESLGLVGESGCGKSTLVRLIARLIDPTGGRIAFEGTDIGSVTARRFGRRPERAKIQVVFQDPTDSLNPHFRAFEAIADPIKLLRPELSNAEVEARAIEVANECGFPTELLDRYPHQLSGGQKARVGIARALGPEPEVVILDEPTSALDVSVQAVILHLLADLRARLGVTYLFVSHDLNVVRLLCDRVAVMYLGKIVEIAPVDALFEAPRHPYTRALIDAIPGRGVARDRHIGGEPKSPIDPDPNACRFHGRCPRGTETCTKVMPLLEPEAAAHRFACHHPLEAA